MVRLAYCALQAMNLSAFRALSWSFLHVAKLKNKNSLTLQISAAIRPSPPKILHSFRPMLWFDHPLSPPCHGTEKGPGAGSCSEEVSAGRLVSGAEESGSSWDPWSCGASQPLGPLWLCSLAHSVPCPKPNPCLAYWLTQLLYKPATSYPNEWFFTSLLF